MKPSRRDRETVAYEKRACLRALMAREGEKLRNAIVFCNRKTDASILHKSLVKHGYNAGALHGDLDQSVRMATLGGFRDGEIKLLVASDVAARGLDIPNVSHVFNFDVPIHSEDYVHRIGRTGRAGRVGKALTIAVPLDRKYLDRIEEMLGKAIDRIEPPEAPAAEGRRRPERRPRRSRDEVPQAVETRVEETVPEAAPAKPAAKGRGKGEGRRGRGGGRGDDRVVDMGDHVPAFLMREARPAKAPKADEDTVETEDAAA